MEVGATEKLVNRWASLRPGSCFSSTAKVASGVMSRGAGPVPPVVRISGTFWLIQVFSAPEIFSFSSETITGNQSKGEFHSLEKTRSSSGPPLSS